MQPAAPRLISLEIDITLFKSFTPNEPQASAMLHHLLDRCDRLKNLSISPSLLSTSLTLPQTLTRLKVYAPKESDRYPSPFAKLIVLATKGVGGLKEVEVPFPRDWIASSGEYRELEAICKGRDSGLRFSAMDRETLDGFNPTFLLRE